MISIDSFQHNIKLTSTPKRSNKSSYIQPLSSTLSISNNSYKKMNLSISAITSNKNSSLYHKKKYRYYHRRRTSTIIKRIELKYLLYSIRVMKQQKYKQRSFTNNQMKIYIL